jgi:putative two-component system response regulator
MRKFQEFGDIALLSVEDDSFNQELASAIFETESNIIIHQACDGLDAIKVLEQITINIILLDIVMPNMNGIELLKFIKQSKRYQHIPVIMVTSEDTEKKATYLLGADDFISKPYQPEELKLRVFNHLKKQKFNTIIAQIEDNITQNQRDTDKELTDIQKAIRLVENSQRQFLEKLGNISHQTPHYDKNASKRLGEYAKLLADIYGLEKSKINNIFYSMSIYNIGLLRIQKEDLKDADSKGFKQYPLLGMEVLKGIENTALIQLSKEVILYHRENWDGSGYPKGLKAQAIPITARIVAIIDYYDELTTSRSYSKDKMNIKDAISIISKEKGIRFDPNLLEMFLYNQDKFKEIKQKFT